MLDIAQFKDPLIRATASYGYGFSVNMMQLVKAFNVFNNNGNMIEPKLTRKVALSKSKILDITKKERPVISQVTALKMLKILRKAVTKGTAMNGHVDGVYTAGKTGTAHVAREGKYEDVYHSTFLGFANEIGGARRYTIGVLVTNPKTDYYASKTAVPIFKACVEKLAERGWLTVDTGAKEE
jgi:cell division protein FtsI (penicillin-binding protein 3)